MITESEKELLANAELDERPSSVIDNPWFWGFWIGTGLLILFIAVMLIPARYSGFGSLLIVCWVGGGGAWGYFRRDRAAREFDRRRELLLETHRVNVAEERRRWEALDGQRRVFEMIFAAGPVVLSDAATASRIDERLEWLRAAAYAVRSGQASPWPCDGAATWINVICGEYDDGWFDSDDDDDDDDEDLELDDDFEEDESRS